MLFEISFVDRLVCGQSSAIINVPDNTEREIGRDAKRKREGGGGGENSMKKARLISEQPQCAVALGTRFERGYFAIFTS